MRVLPAVVPMLGGTIEAIVTVGDGDPPSWSLTLGLGFDRAVLVENAPLCGLHDHGGPAPVTREFATVLAALHALDPDARTTLGLDADRLVALAAIDEIRGALAGGDLAAARDRVARAMPELERAFAVAATGDWKLRRPVLANAEQLARFAEHVLADFACSPQDGLGRLRQLAQGLGAIARDDRERRAAFVEPAENVVELPIEVAHPLRRDERVTAVPFISEDERADLVFPPSDRYAGQTIIIDPLTALYDQLKHTSQRIEHLRRVEAPPAVLDGEVETLQRIVDELAATARTPPDIVDAWEMTGTRRDRVELSYREPISDGMDVPPAVLWLDDETIATTRGDRLVVIALATGDVVREHAIGGATVQGCDETGRFVVVGAEPVEYGGFGLGCLDLSTGEWLAELPAHVPAISFGYDELSVSTLYEHRRDARARASALAFSRGMQSVLISRRNDAIEGGGICATASLFSEVAPAVLLDAARRRGQRILRADGALVDATPEAAEAIDREMMERTSLYAHLPWPAAIAKHRFLLPSLHVGDVDNTYFRLGFPIDCACFSPDGERLLVAGAELLAIDLPNGAIVHRLAR